MANQLAKEIEETCNNKSINFFMFFIIKQIVRHRIPFRSKNYQSKKIRLTSVAYLTFSCIASP
jgi:hypothetical protein